MYLVQLGLWCLTPLSVISRWSVLLVEETGIPGENHVTSHWQLLPHIAVSSTPCHEHDSNFSGHSTDYIDTCSCKSNYHTITTRVLRLRCLTPLSTILAFKHHNPSPTPHCITTMTGAKYDEKQRRWNKLLIYM